MFVSVSRAGFVHADRRAWICLSQCVCVCSGGVCVCVWWYLLPLWSPFSLQVRGRERPPVMTLPALHTPSHPSLPRADRTKGSAPPPCAEMCAAATASVWRDSWESPVCRVILGVPPPQLPVDEALTFISPSARRTLHNTHNGEQAEGRLTAATLYPPLSDSEAEAERQSKPSSPHSRVGTLPLVFDSFQICLGVNLLFWLLWGLR